jgi:hypothetical protein
MSHYKDLFVLSIVFVLSGCTESKEPIKTGAEPKKIETQLISAEDTVSKVSSAETGEDKHASEQIPEQKETKAPEESPRPVSTIKSISELWKTYKKAKDDADNALEKGDIKSIANNLKLAGECAVELGRNDIAAWQFNNVGHYSIEEFKKRTGCDNKLRILATMQSGDEKEKFLDDTKELFTKEISLLNQAETNLQRAQIIDDELEKSRRSDVIESNLEFIAWVKEFIQ